MLYVKLKGYRTHFFFFSIALTAEMKIMKHNSILAFLFVNQKVAALASAMWIFHIPLQKVKVTMLQNRFIQELKPIYGLSADNVYQFCKLL